MCFLMRPPCSLQSVFPLSVNVTEVHHSPAAGVLLKALRKTKVTKVLSMLQRFVSCWSSSYRQRTGEAVGVNEGWEAAPPWSAAGGETAGCHGGGVGLRQQRVWSQTWQEAPSPAVPDRKSPRWVRPEADGGRGGRCRR